MKFRNLTDCTIEVVNHLSGETVLFIEPEYIGLDVIKKAIHVDSVHVKDIPFFKIYHKVNGLPEPQADTMLIVPYDFFMLVSDRYDICCPDTWPEALSGVHGNVFKANGFQVHHVK